ncbi:MAG: helix-turn-helix transcriptional regulator [Christensenellaceae bacterium]|nr:helix-turn-helix transcriptional regulator [Christensenellaceae bacterium]
MDVSAIGRAIRACRKEKKLTLEVVSGLAGIDRAHLTRIETGEYIPKMDTFFKIATALNIPPAQLVERIDKAQQE